MLDEWLEEAHELSDRYDPLLNGRVMDRYLARYEVCTDPEERKRIRASVERRLNRAIVKTRKFKHTVLAVPDSETAKGEIVLGKVMWGDWVLYDFGISLRELNKHLLIVGQTGGGKTTLINNIIAQLVALGIPFVVFDRAKRESRHLAKRFPEILVINWKDLRVNPLLPPPDITFDEWKLQLELIFGHVEGTWSGSTQYLLQFLDEVHRELGDASTLKHVYDRVMAAMSEPNRKMQEYWGVIQTRLYGLVTKVGRVFNSGETIDLAKLLKMQVVLELDDLEKDGDFIVAWFMMWFFAYQKAHNLRDKLLLVMIVDEAQSVFSAADSESMTVKEFSKESPLDRVAAKTRALGGGVIAATQMPTKISHALKANTHVKLAGNLGDGTDIQDIAASMGLDEDEAKALTRLGWGEWMVKMPERFAKPFLIKSEELVPLVRDVTDEQLHAMMGERIRNLMVRRHPKEEAREMAETNPTSISADGMTLLRQVNECPFDAVRTRMKKLGFSGRRIKDSAEELRALGLIRPVKASVGKHKPITLLEITQSGKKLLKELGVDVRLWDKVGHVGMEHLYYQVLIANAYRKRGYEVRTEAVLGERRFDVLASARDKRVGIEVELSWNPMDNKLDNVEMVDELIIVARGAGMLEQIKKCVQKRGLASRVKVMKVAELMEELKDSIAGESLGTNALARNKQPDAPERNEAGTKGADA